MSPPHRPPGRPLVATLYAGAVHAIAISVVLYALIVLLPRYERTFVRHRLATAPLTQLVLGLSHGARTTSVLVLFPLLLGDGFIFYFLRTRCRSRAPATLWSAMIVLLVLAAAVAIVMGIRLPLEALKTRLGQ